MIRNVHLISFSGFIKAQQNYTINGWTVPVVCPEVTLCGDGVLAIESFCSMSKAGISSGICNCDPECHYFMDCCADYFQECHEPDTFPEDFGKAVEELDLDQFSCYLPPGTALQTHWYLLVAKCAPHWEDRQGIRELCEGNTNTSDPLTIIPVTYMNSISFKNVYCVICNRLDTASVASWRIATMCSIGPHGRDIPDSTTSLEDLRYVLRHMVL